MQATILSDDNTIKVVVNKPELAEKLKTEDYKMTLYPTERNGENLKLGLPKSYGENGKPNAGIICWPLKKAKEIAAVIAEQPNVLSVEIVKI